MGMIVVRVADCQISDQEDDVLVTYALGSCVAVAIHDPVAGVGGMLHFMLPDSAIDQARAKQNPYMFADTGIPLLFRRAYERGAKKQRLVVRAAGAARVAEAQDVFQIARRNYLAMRSILRKAGVPVQAEDVGGTASRTLRLEVGTGRVWLRGGGSESELSRMPGRRPEAADA